MNVLNKVKCLAVISIFLFFIGCQTDDFENTLLEDMATVPDEREPNENEGITNEEELEAGSITLYNVAGSVLTKTTDFSVSAELREEQQATDKHQKIWNLVLQFVPESYLTKINQFVIYSGEIGESAGYVFPTTKDLSQWRLGIAIDVAYEGGFNAGGELAHTIVHELGHIITLDELQLDATVEEADCSNYFPGEGCAKPEAYINGLYDQFWADIWTDFQRAEDDDEKLDAFYNRYQERYVTPYASTNPGEDIAEVFAAMVFNDTFLTSSSKAGQKVQFLFGQPELFALREHMRNTKVSTRKQHVLSKQSSHKGSMQRTGISFKGCGTKKRK